ncbi:uncharacterized protein LOC123322331 [Coccinella septempunctata]|uniref:uncharacterized protein LOC123322331 n=1 Tax=Coccinella septempunctata TaxID=41139 RepID=UPI001D09302B|nr:uncharacterized protein LOC123322331 [Coccinella septempunctata]
MSNEETRIAKAFLNTQEFSHDPNQLETSPSFSFRFELLLFEPLIIFPKYLDSPVYNHDIVQSLIQDLHITTTIFTDGSKDPLGIGCAFFIPNLNLTRKFKLPKSCSIFTAEAVAIEKSLKWCIENGNGNDAIIFSDSRSVLENINNIRSINKRRPLIYRIRNLLMKASHKNMKIFLVWVKGHSGIDGNEIVDASAKDARISGEILNIPCYPDILAEFKHGIRKKWKHRWKEIGQNISKNKYFLIHPDLPKKVPHIFAFDVNKKYCTIITRMKINHGLFNEHLHQIGISNSPLCAEDEEIADLNHLIFSCSKTREKHELIEKLLETNIQLPVNIQALLASENKNVYDILVEHIIKNGILISNT